MRLYALAALLFVGTIPYDDLEDSFERLKDAQARKDIETVKDVAVRTRALAREIASQPAPEGDSEKALWIARIERAKGIENFSEYALYSTATQCGNPTSTVDLLATLEKENPKSQYLDEGYSSWFVALHQSGTAASIPAVAERALKYFPDNEDALLVLADRAMTRNEPDRALTYAERLLKVMTAHAKPIWMQASDWERKRSQSVMRARWIAGIMHSQKGQYYEADKDLRITLPLVQGNQAMLASTLFHLGVANYQLAAQVGDRPRMLEAARFSEAAAKIKGPLSQQAWRNSNAMKAAAQKIR